MSLGAKAITAVSFPASAASMCASGAVAKSSITSRPRPDTSARSLGAGSASA